MFLKYKFLNSAGGLSYHWRAFKYAHSLWRDTRQQLKNWLEDWDIEYDEILLIGPSAGYTLPTEWLARFKTKWAIEPDPVARTLFEHRFGKTKWVNRPLYPENHLSRLVAEFKDSPILFCNILGQVPLLYRRQILKEPQSFESWKTSLQTNLQKRFFASYHDLYSSQQDFEVMAHETSADLNFGSLARWPMGAEIIDHQISDLFKNFPHRRFIKWSLTPRHHHLLEACHSHSKTGV